MELLLILIAVSWHTGLVVLERRLSRNGATPSLLRLLFTAEIELLRALRTELRGLSTKDEDTAGRLFRVEQRLRELGEYG